MIVRSIAISTALAVTACSAPTPVNNTANTNTANANTGGSLFETNTATPATAPADGSEAAIKGEQYAKCAMTMLTMSRIYTVLAESESGAKRDDLEADAAKRKKVAALFYEMAVDNATKAGRTKADVEDIGREVQAGYDKTREQSFNEFATQVAGDADRCQEIARAAT